MVKALPVQKQSPTNSVNISRTSVQIWSIKIAPASKSFQDFINSVPSDSLSSFTHVTADELKTITKGFKDGKAPGADNIPISIIRKTLDLISDGLLSIINLSLSSGVFPDRLKRSKIILSLNLLTLAQYKTTDRFLYFLPFLKFLKEMSMIAYFNSQSIYNDILFKHQFGFRPGPSSSHA